MITSHCVQSVSGLGGGAGAGDDCLAAGLADGVAGDIDAVVKVETSLQSL